MNTGSMTAKKLAYNEEANIGFAGLLRGWMIIFGISILGTSLMAQDADFKKADLLFNLQSFDEAISFYEKSLQKNPGNAKAFAKMGDAYRRTNRMNKAAEAYAKAINTSNYENEVLFEYGLTLKCLGRYSEAMQWFNSYAAAQPIRGSHFAQSCSFAQTQSKAAASYKITKELINSAGADFGPAFYGKSLVYASSRSDIKNSAIVGQQNYANEKVSQLFVANIDRRDRLGKPKLLLEGIQAQTNVGPATFTKNNQKVYYTKNAFVDGVRWLSANQPVLSIHEATVKGKSWEESKPLNFNSGDYAVAFPSISEDGNTLYFASDSPDGFGGFDIYVSYKQNDKWSKPVNLGDEINTPGDEITPFINGNTLYFSSNWHWGMGGYDIFKAVQKNGQWQGVAHLGKDINSTRDDVGFIFDNKKSVGYFSSNRLGGKGDYDIYSAKPTRNAPKPIDDVQPPSKPTADNNSNNNNQPKPSGNGRDQIITIRVVSELGGNPLSNASVDFSACGSQTFTTNAGGQYQFEALAGLNCNVTVSKQGYENKMVNIYTTNADYRTLEVALMPLDKGFAGYVVDATSSQPIENVYVSAVNITNNDELNGISDNQGRYVLGLAPNTAYKITFSKSGFKNAEFAVNTLDGSNKMLLGKQALERSATFVEPGTKAIDDKPLIKPSARGVTEAWAIQIGVFRDPNIAELQKLKVFGNVFREPVGDLMRYKIGTYKSKAEADAMKKRIVSQTGQYQDALITKIINSDVIDQTYIDRDINPNSIDIPGGKNRPGSENDVALPGIVYRIQLGAFSNPASFDKNAYADLGTVIQDQRTLASGQTLTIYLLGEFKTLETANIVKQRVQARGGKNAYVVRYKNGKRVAISD